MHGELPVVVNVLGPQSQLVPQNGAGHAHACYVVANGELRYATNASGSWHVARIASGVRASDDRTTAIAIDTQGRVHVATFGALAPLHVTNR